MKTRTLAGLSLIAFTIMGCDSKSPEDYITEARNHIASNSNDSAIISLKNAIAESPDNTVARFLLGKIYLEQGMAANAEKELGVAMDRGHDLAEVLPLYARALYMQRKNDELINFVDGVPNTNTDVQTSLLIYKALSLYRKGNLVEAEDSIKMARDLAEDSMMVKFGLAHQAMGQQDFTASLTMVDELLQASPDFADAYFLKGQLHLLTGDFDAAIANISKYVEMLPADNYGKFMLAESYVKAKDFSKAEKLINDLLKIAPNHGYLNQLKGLVEFSKQDYNAANIAMEKSIAAGSNAPVARLIAGVSAYKLDNLEQAHKHLAAVQSMLPADHTARKLFAEIQLKLGYNTEAVNTLKQLQGLTPEDARLFTMASHELMEEGLTDQAGSMLAIATSLNSQELDELVRIGILKLSLEDLSGVLDLEKVIAADAKNDEANWALAKEYMRQERYEDALSIAQKWIKEEPSNPSAHNLKATIYEVAGRLEDAQSSFKEALEISPNSPYTLTYFIKKALEAEDVETALALSEKLATSNPDFIDGLFKNYLLSQRFADPSKALKLIKEAFERNADDILYRLNYARALTMENKHEEVLSVLGAVKPDVSYPDTYWKMLSSSNLALEKPDDAVNVYKRWQALAPNNLQAWIGELMLHDMGKEFGKALNTVKEAQNYHPENPTLLLMNAHYLLLSGSPDKSEKLLLSLDEAIKEQPFAKGIQGQISYSKGEFEKAIPLLKEYYDVNPSGRFAIFISNAWRNLDKKEMSFDVLEEHLRRFPSDINTRMRLAERYMQDNADAAVKHYEQIIEATPKNIIALNNVAFILGQQKRYPQAQAYIEAALALVPEHPTLLDTYGVILLDQGKKEQAKEQLSKAYKLAPESENIKNHYERAMQQ
ncbi:PEP-CTERM system TPR-repeat protein PrsT [Aliiglaciecola sp. CAU 1673]|uniref:XrtA/PEP-CTERM system TPR-repeat protein PrsT n=1 Tax=Aliiglaciecola sp. CAU 1673 TaxID=3032595 RepID=UPI0023DAC621|nr:XrtA/PEP-CTERM system TPR-repeat protein PrsT [Aliiglaciecola sp. CAU 1673]MDF2177322.1 PEP-CTERM system TPR-repeat protein PrsT [Aliiglaciecola sp. CAU 1673]